MKILMTGATVAQIGRVATGGSSIQKIDVPRSAAAALREAGHEVDHRRVEPGEDLSSYDVAWVNLAAINSMHGRDGATGTLWTTANLPCVGFFDDWSFTRVFNGFQAVWRDGNSFMKYRVLGPKGLEYQRTHYSLESAERMLEQLRADGVPWVNKLKIVRHYMRDTDESARKYGPMMYEQSRALCNDRWAQGMVPACPMYSWGDHTIVSDKMLKLAPDLPSIEMIDPSSVIYDSIAEHTPLPVHEKANRWVMGSLSPQVDWVERQDFEWPIDLLGSITVARRHGGQRLKSESDVIAHYNSVKGILSPPYPHAGSGWWRSRFMYSARVRSVLVADWREVEQLGDGYNITMKDLEQLAKSDHDYTRIADQQADTLRQYMPPADQFARRCVDIVTRAKDEDKGW